MNTQDIRNRWTPVYEKANARAKAVGLALSMKVAFMDDALNFHPSLTDKTPYYSVILRLYDPAVPTPKNKKEQSMQGLTYGNMYEITKDGELAEEWTEEPEVTVAELFSLLDGLGVGDDPKAVLAKAVTKRQKETDEAIRDYIAKTAKPYKKPSLVMLFVLLGLLAVLLILWLVFFK